MKAAHNLYYPGGAEAGYDFHEDETGNYDGLIYKLWGYDRDSVPYIRFVLNNDSANYRESLTRNVEDGDSFIFISSRGREKTGLPFLQKQKKWSRREKL